MIKPSETRSSEVREGETDLVSIPGIVELVRRRVFRLESLALDVSKRRHWKRRSPLSALVVYEAQVCLTVNRRQSIALALKSWLIPC